MRNRNTSRRSIKDSIELISTIKGRRLTKKEIGAITPAVLQNYSNDHDLLTTVNTTVKNIEVTVNKLNDNTVTKAEHKELITELNDHEKRIRDNTTDVSEVKTQISTWGKMILIIIPAVQIAVVIILHFWTK